MSRTVLNNWHHMAAAIMLAGITGYSSTLDSQPFLTNGLAAYYPFNGNANDASGNGKHGVNNGAVPTADRFGNPTAAYAFNQSYVSLDANRPITGTQTNFSFSLWFRANNTSGGDLYTHRGHYRDVALNWSRGTPASPGVVAWHVWDTASQLHAVLSPVLPTNQWVHCVGTYDGGVQSLYVNGALVGTSEWSGAVDWNQAFLAEGIGGVSASGGAYMFNGDLDDIRVYTRALGSNEVAQLHALESVQPPPEPCPTPEGLVAWWKGESNVLDSIGHSDGSLLGGAGFAAGQVGQAFQVNGGVGNLVRIPDAPALNVTNQLTFEAWVNPTVYPSVNAVMIAGKDAPAGVRQYMIGMANTTGKWIFRAHLGLSSGFQVMDGTNAVPTNAWSHVLMSYDGAQFRLYVNGQLDASMPATGAIVTSAAPVWIGGFGTGPWNFDGLVDEVSLYGRALATNEIAAIYNAGSAGKCTPDEPPAPCDLPVGIVAMWKAESNGLDSVGTSHGSLTGITTFGDGKVGQGFVFDDKADGVDLGNPAALHLQNLTIEGWIKRGSASTVSAGPGSNGNLFGGGYGSYLLFLDSNAAMRFARLGDVAPPPGPQVVDTQFHHIAVTKNGTKLVYYLDGVAYPAPDITSTFTFTTPIGIGFSPADRNHNFLGTVDELSVYNRALATNEIAAIYTAGSAGKCLPPPPACDLPDGIVSWWKGETNAADAIGSNHGTLMGGAGFAPGKVGEGFLLDGQNDWVSIPDAASLDLTNEITVEMWFKSEVWSAGASHALLDKRDLSSCNYGVNVSQAWGLQLYYNDPAVFGGDHPGNQIEISAHFPLPSVGVFHHFAGTYKQVDAQHIQLRTYLNGALIEERLFNGNLANTVNGMALGIGASRGGAGEFFRGVIDEVSLYNRALGSNEIAAIYTAGSAGKCPPQLPVCELPEGIAAWWKLEGNGADAVGTNVGTLFGAPVFAPGKVGEAMVFDGSNDQLRAAASPSLNVGAGPGMTIEGWVLPSTVAPQLPLVEWNNGLGTIGTHFWLSVPTLGGGVGSLWVNFIDTNGVAHQISSAPGLINTNAYQHVALTYNKVSGAAALYVNGSPVAQTNLGTFTADTRFDVDLGYRRSGVGAGARYRGKMDEISIYGRALAANEIAAIHQAGSAGKCPPQPPACDLPDGIVSWWKAENDGNDSIGSNHGSPVGTVTYSNGKVGQAFNFNGASRVQIPDADSLDFTNTMTVETWVNLRTYSGVNSREIVSKFGGPYMNEASFTLAIDPSTKKAYYIVVSSNGASGIVYSSAIIPTNQWVHLAGVYDGAAVRVYVNGQLNGSTPWSQPPRVGRNPLVIGCTLQNNSVATSFFNGLIDEVSLYNRALGSNEIAAIHHADSAGKCTPDAEPPVITQNPVATAVILGDPVSFEVVATGTAPLKYQWLFNGGSILGAVGPTFTLSEVQLADQGGYSVIVSNSAGAVTSSGASLSVILPECTEAPAGIVAWLPLDGSGMDSAGTNHGVLSGAPAFGVGKVGQAMTFDGVNDHLRALASPSLNVGSGAGMTIETWIKPGTLATQRPLLEWNDGLGTIGSHLWVSVVSGLGGGPGSLFANLVDTNGVSHQILTAPATLNTNSYQHVALTYDKLTGAAALFVNGTPLVQTNLGIFTPDTRSDFYLGLRPSGVAAGARYRGAMDEVSIYNRALATNEIAAIYAARGEGKCPLTPTILAVTPPGASVNEGADVEFTATAAGSPPLAYQWQFNGDDIAEATGATLSLSNVVYAQAGSYTVVVSGPGGTTSTNVVLDINRAPLANAGASELLVVSPNGSNAIAVLYGSLSSDPDGDALSYAWYVTGEASPFASGVVAVTTLPLGTNLLTLVVDDGMATGSQDFAVEVITTSEAVDRLALLSQTVDGNPQPLLVALRLALKSIDRSKPELAINILEVFKKKVLAQVMPTDPELAAQLLADAQAIIDALNGGPEFEIPVEITSIGKSDNGKPKLKIRGRNDRAYVVEASTNMVDWTAVGVAGQCGDCAFEFEDTQSPLTGVRYYRVVAPK